MPDIAKVSVGGELLLTGLKYLPSGKLGTARRLTA
jgi:hypothetical protein